MTAMPRPPRRRGQRGVALIEALVGVLIFCLGILGLIGLQASLTRAQGAATFRADAAYLATGFVGQMWADRPNLTQYNTGTCASHPRCADWADKIATTLPGGKADVQANSAGDVTLTITWSTSTEGTHQYVLATTIR